LHVTSGDDFDRAPGKQFQLGRQTAPIKLPCVGGAAMKKTGGQRQVYLVDDHPLMRESLAVLLQQELGLVICGEADNATRAEREIEEKKPDLAILDISLKESSGVDLIRSLRSTTPQLKIIVLSMHDERLYAERCIQGGANRYLMKRAPSERILAAVSEVLGAGGG
jgi:DNA-binding NarL/FixJ family response regulator